MTICSLKNPVYRPSGPLGLNYALGNRGLRPRQRIYQPSGLRTARRRSPAKIRLFVFSPEGGTSSAGGDNHRSRHPQSAKPGGLAHPSGEWRSVAYKILCIGPPGLSDSIMHLATGAFDPGRGYTSPPGLEPRVVDLPQRSGCLVLARRAALLCRCA
jgi:hypothetical protein